MPLVSCSEYQQLSLHYAARQAGFNSTFLPCNLVTLRRIGRKQRPTPGFPQPSFAASSGFLNLLTLYSASQPFRPYFMPVTPLGFRLQRPLRDSRSSLSGDLPSAVSNFSSIETRFRSTMRTLSKRVDRRHRPVLPGTYHSMPSMTFFPLRFPSSGLGFRNDPIASSHGLGHAATQQAALRQSALQSFKEPENPAACFQPTNPLWVS